MKNFRPHPAAKFMPRVTGEELLSIEKSIGKRGLLEPIKIHQGKVIDGLTRLEICRRLGITPKYEVAVLGKRSPEEYVLDINLERRSYTPTQRAALAMKLLPVMEEEARGRMREAAKKGVTPRGATSTSKALAKKTGASSRTIDRMKVIAKTAPHLIDEMAAGKLTVKQVEKTIRSKAQRKAIKKYVPPKGQFQVITVDFSWTYRDKLDGNDQMRGAPPYPPQSVDEIVKFIRGPLARCCDEKACVLGSWITGPISLDLTIAPVVQAAIEKLGFRPLHERIWEKEEKSGKDFVGLGRGIRWNAEKLQLYVRGDVVINETGSKHGRPLQSTVFRAPIGKHSEKPQRAYDDLELLFPYTKRLEMFARAPRRGWTTTGAELAQPPANGDSAVAQPVTNGPEEVAISLPSPHRRSPPGGGLGTRDSTLEVRDAIGDGPDEDPTVITSEYAHEMATRLLEVMLKAKPAADTPEFIKCAALAAAIEDYEKKRWPIAAPTAAEAAAFRAEQETPDPASITQPDDGEIPF